MYRLIPAVVGLFFLAACADSTDDLDALEISGGSGQPSISNLDGFTVDETQSKIIRMGDGGVIERGNVVRVHIVAYSGSDGAQLTNTYEEFGDPQKLVISEAGLPPDILGEIQGKTIGSRIVIAAVVPGMEDAGETETIVYVIDLISRQECDATADDLPRLVMDDSPNFERTDDTPDEVDDVLCHVVEEGDGNKIEAGDSITVNYAGQIYPDGQTFDSSWDRGEAITFDVGVGRLIGCWDEGLVGRSVGSTVILACPPQDAYGDNGSGEIIQPGDTLVFAVEILDAS